MKILILVFLLILSPVSAKTSKIENLIDKTTVYLIETWNKDENLNKLYPPKVIAVPSGTRIYGGGCKGSNKGVDVAGSHYCPADNTIILDPTQLKTFIKAFGNSSVAYVISHEFAHALQKALEIRLKNPNHELQADCLAGYFLQMGNKELGITRESILEMASAAYAIGGETHGSGAQRAYALLSGMGRVDSTCSIASIDKLVEGKINDPLYKAFTKTRGSGKNMDLDSTPYKKDAAGLLGANINFLSTKLKFKY